MCAFLGLGVRALQSVVAMYVCIVLRTNAVVVVSRDPASRFPARSAACVESVHVCVCVSLAVSCSRNPFCQPKRGAFVVFAFPPPPPSGVAPRAGSGSLQHSFLPLPLGAIIVCVVRLAVDCVGGCREIDLLYRLVFGARWPCRGFLVLTHRRRHGK